MVCTLIFDYNPYSYLAEDSFYLQIQSNGIKEIEYSDIEVEWLISDLMNNELNAKYLFLILGKSM